VQSKPSLKFQRKLQSTERLTKPHHHPFRKEYQMTHQINNDIEAFTLALRLAVSAPTDELSKKPLDIAEKISRRLTLEEVNEVKAMLEKEVK